MKGHRGHAKTRAFAGSYLVPFHPPKYPPARFDSKTATSKHLPFGRDEVFLPMNLVVRVREEPVVFGPGSNLPIPACREWKLPPTPQKRHRHMQPGCDRSGRLL